MGVSAFFIFVFILIFSFSIHYTFRLKGRSSSRLLAGSTPVLPSALDFACSLCLLPASRHAEASNMKTSLDMTTLNLDLLITGDNEYISTPYLGIITVLK